MGGKWLLAVVGCAGCACKDEQTAKPNNLRLGAGGYFRESVRETLGAVETLGQSTQQV